MVDLKLKLGVCLPNRHPATTVDTLNIVRLGVSEIWSLALRSSLLYGN